MTRLLDWFRAAFAQDDFAGDWYGWLTNQISHMAGGVLAALVVAACWFGVVGEFPWKPLAVGLIGAGYVGGEVLRSWSGWDSVEDTLFFAVYGSGGAFLVFHEVTPGSPLLVVSVQNVVPVVMIAGAHLMGGVLRRSKGL